MAKYLPTVDLWNPETRADLDSGALKLQPGQWFVCGDKAATRSRFYRHNAATGHVVAFHGEPGKGGVATRKMRQYVQASRDAAQAVAERRATREVIGEIVDRMVSAVRVSPGDDRMSAFRK